MQSDPQAAKAIFRRSATRFYLINIAVVLALAAALYAASLANYYAQAFVPITILFLVWLFNAGRLLRCPVCKNTVRSREGLIRMPVKCESCGVLLR